MAAQSRFAATLCLAALALACARTATGPRPANEGASPSAAQASPSAPAQTAAASPPPDADPCAGRVSPLPPPQGFVNDFAGVIDTPARLALADKAARLKQRANVELAVVTVETTGDVPISDYSLAVACGWGVGPPPGEEGGGLLLLVAVRDRRWHVQVSRRLEADLPDAEVAEIGARMQPHLIARDYARALDVCVDGLVARLAEKRNFQP